MTITKLDWAQKRYAWTSRNLASITVSTPSHVLCMVANDQEQLIGFTLEANIVNKRTNLVTECNAAGNQH